MEIFLEENLIKSKINVCLSLGFSEEIDNKILNALSGVKESKFYKINSTEDLERIHERVDFLFFNIGTINEISNLNIIVNIYEKMRYNSKIFFFNGCDINNFTKVFEEEILSEKLDLICNFISSNFEESHVQRIEDQILVKVKKEIIYHVYSINWNEEKILPKFFQHYHQADKIFILDNMSDDNSHEIINYHKGEIIPFDTGGKLNDVTNMNLKNKCWKNSREADFVIIIDLDEFLFFPNYPNDIKSALKYLSDENKTLVLFKGYNMYCTDEFFDNILEDQQLFSTITNGNENPFPGCYDKVACISPNNFSSFNYGPGAHWIENYKGNHQLINYGILLHYKYIGRKYCKERFNSFFRRMSNENINRGYGRQYYMEQTDRINFVFNNFSQTSIFNLIFPNMVKFEYNKRNCTIEKYDELEIVFHRNKFLLEPKVCNYIKFKCENNNTTYIDIGFGIGHHIYVAKLCGSKNIIGIESNREKFKKLKKTIFINGWRNMKLYNTSFSENMLDFNNSENSEDSENENRIIVNLKNSELLEVKKMENFFKDTRVCSVILKFNYGIFEKDDLFEIVEFMSLNFDKIILISNMKYDPLFGEEIKIFCERNIIDKENLYSLILNDEIPVVSFERE